MYCSSYRRLPLHWDCHRVGACTQLAQRNWWACMQDGQEEVGDFRKWLVTFAEHKSLWRLRLWGRFSQRLADKGLLRHISLTKIEQQASQTAIVNEENTHEARLSLHLFTHQLLVDLVQGFSTCLSVTLSKHRRSCGSNAVHLKWPILVLFKVSYVMLCYGCDTEPCWLCVCVYFHSNICSV